MSLSTNVLSYADVQTAMDKALDAEKGIIVTTRDRGAAIHLRQRCYQFRRLDRENSKKIFPPEHPAFGNSVYDVLVVEQVENRIFIRKTNADDLQIEEIA